LVYQLKEKESRDKEKERFFNKNLILFLGDSIKKDEFEFLYENNNGFYLKMIRRMEGGERGCF